MKKEILITLLFGFIIMTNVAQPYQGNVKSIWYEPDTVKSYDIDYDTDDLIPSILISYTYNTLGLKLSEEQKYWDEDINQFSNEYGWRHVYAYNSDNLLETDIEEAWDVDAQIWVQNYKMEYEYQNGLKISEIWSDWNVDSSLFVNSMRILYTYDENDNPTSYITETWSGTDWEFNYGYQIIYDYDQQFNVLSKTEINLSDSTNFHYYAYTYDANGNVLSDTFDYAQNGVRVKFNYNIYTYDANQNLMQRTTMEWSEDSTDYIHASWNGRITYAYDGNNNRTSHLRETYDYNLGYWRVDGWNPRITWEYENDNAVLIQAFYFDEDEGEWVNGISGHVDLHYNNMKSGYEMMAGGHLFEISYIGFQGEVSIKEENAMPVQCYPNPTQDKIYFTGLTERSLVSIYDMSGKKIASQRVSNQDATFDMGAYQSGIYFVEIKNSTQKYTKKVVLLPH